MADVITTLGKVGDLALRTAEFLPGQSEAGKLLRQKFSADARLATALDEAHLAWWARIWDKLAEHDRQLNDAEREDLRERLLHNDEAGILIANYADEAYREPLKRRREMLEHAVVGVCDMGLSLDELARVWRFLRTLAPTDVQALYGLWLVANKQPGQDPFHRNGPGARRAKLAHDYGTDALVSAGAVQIKYVGEGAGSGGTHEELEITRSGRLILSSLRTFLKREAIPFIVPEHNPPPNGRAEQQAQQMLDEVDPVSLLRKYQNRRFNNLLTYDCLLSFGASNVETNVPANGRAQLVFRDVTADDRAQLPRPTPREIPLGRPVDDIWLQTVTEHEVHLCGPQDVLRLLAYDLFAAW